MKHSFMHSNKPYWITYGPFCIVPAIHYTMELAAEVRRAFIEVKPDCVAVELPENMQEALFHASKPPAGYKRALRQKV